MKKTEIINNKIVNWVEQLASVLKHGDVFRKPRGNTQYKVKALIPEEKVLICENLDTHLSEEIYSNSPVYRLHIL